MISADSPLRSGLLQRILTGAVLALVLARAFVLGDDPGRLRLTTGAGSIVLTVLTFVALFVWAFQRGFHQLSDRRSTGFGGGLLLVALWLFVRPLVPGEASYLRPQWFIAWEWFALAVTIFLVRRVCGSSETSRSLLSGIVAVAVAISATSIAQQVALKEPGAKAILELDPKSLPGSDEFVGEIDGRVASESPIRGTFDTPETFAQILLLLLPLGIALAWAGFRDGSPTGYALFALGVVILAALLMALFEFAQRPTADPARGIPAGFAVVQQSPLTGVGGGNFSRCDPAFRSGASSAWLTFAAQFGIPAAVALVAIVAFGLIRLRNSDGIAVDPATVLDARPRVAWELYIGGIFGLLLGFVLSRWDVPAESPPRDVLAQGIQTGIRSLIWFAVFSLLERVALPTRTLLRTLFAGLVVVAACGMVSDSLLTLPLLHSFAILLAIGINLAHPPTAIRVLSLPRALLPFVAMLPLIPLYWFHVGEAGTTTTVDIRQARKAGRLFPEKHMEVRRFDGVQPTDKIAAVRKARALVNAEKLLDQLILEPMREAAVADDRNPALHLELARWTRWRWEYLLDMREAEKAAEARNIILKRCEFARRLDPKNPAALMAELEALLLFFDRSGTDRKIRLALFDSRLEQLLVLRPAAEIPMRARLLQRLLEGYSPAVPEAERAAQAENLLRIEREAIRLFEIDAPDRVGHLSEIQRDWLKAKLRTVVARPSAELLAAMGE